MDTTKILKTGRSQAVRLPKKYRFEGNKVYIKRAGPAVVLLPHKPTQTWDAWFAALAQFSSESWPDRSQPNKKQHRPSLGSLFD